MSSRLPVLYSFRRCPYAIRARLALGVAGIAVELHEVDLRHKPARLLALSPAATVPVLDLGQGRVLTQSLEILHWALQQHDPAGWLRHGDPHLNEQLVATTDGAFKCWLDRYKYAERHPGHSAAGSRASAEQCLLVPLEARLARHPHVGGEDRCWADTAVFPFVRQFAAVDPVWWETAPWPATRRWLQAWLEDPLFTACMRKQPAPT